MESILELQIRIGDIGELSELAVRIDILESQLSELSNSQFSDVDLALRQLQGIAEAVGRRIKDLPPDIEAIQRSDQQQLSDSDQKSVQTIATLRGTKQLPQRFRSASDRLEKLLNEVTEQNHNAVVASSEPRLMELLSLCRGIVLIQSIAQDIPSEPSQVLRDAEQFIGPVRELFASARHDLQRLENVSPERTRFMREDEKVRFKRDRDRLNERLAELDTGESGLQVAVDQLKRLRDAHSNQNRAQTVRGLTAWIQSYLQLVERLSLIPAQARLEVIAVEEVELDPADAFQIALANRLDFMNGRAALVDRWRAIQVAADALQSDLTITGNGDVRTARNNPVDFRAATSRLRLGIEFDAPLARLLERNGYRETLIEYQRNRRNLIQSQDSLQKGLRALLRTLRQRRLQLEIQRRAVTIALRRVDQTQLSLLTPPPQGQPGVRPQIIPTTAINLLGAQSSLQSSQNSFLAAWLDYYAARLRLFRELGVMQLDPSGQWIENSVDFGAANESEPPEPLPPPVPVEALELDSPLLGNDPGAVSSSQQNRTPNRPMLVIQPSEARKGS